MGVKEKASEVCAVTIEYKKEGEKRYAAWILGKFDGEWLILSQIPISSKSSEDYSELLNNIRNYKDHFEDDSDEDYEDDERHQGVRHQRIRPLQGGRRIDLHD